MTNIFRKCPDKRINLFRMGLFEAAHEWGGEGGGQKVNP